MFLVNSRLDHFTAPSESSLNGHHQRDPFSRSYGARLPSSLTRFLSRALVYSTFPPVSVLVRLSIRLTRSFSRRCGIDQSASPEGSTSHRISSKVPLDLPGGTPYVLRPSFPIDGWPSLLRHSIAQMSNKQYRNIEPVIHHLRLSASA